MEIKVYTDGGCRNHGNHKHEHVQNNDLAAWAFLVNFGTHKYDDTHGYYGLTNNDMELQAVINALTWLVDNDYNHKTIHLISDSKYILNSIHQNWLDNWIIHDWHNKQGQIVKNAKDWQQIAKLLPQFDNLTFSWTKGHAKNFGNNYVDNLLNQTMDKMTNN